MASRDSGGSGDDSRLVVYFFRARLIQKHAEAPLVYEGTGKAYRTAKGGWMVEVIHEEGTPRPGEEQEPEGEGEESADAVIQPFTLRAVDLSGTAWEAETVRLAGPPGALPSVGRVVRGVMDSLHCRNCPAGPLEDDIWIPGGDEDFEP